MRSDNYLLVYGPYNQAPAFDTGRHAPPETGGATVINGEPPPASGLQTP